MIIEPELYTECAIYDAEMEQQMCELQAGQKEAEARAKEAQATIPPLKAQIDEQGKQLESLQSQFKEELVTSASLRSQLEQRSAEAEANAAAIAKLLSDSGIALEGDIGDALTQFQQQLDGQAADAAKVQADYEEAQKVKRELRDEMDDQMVKAAEVQASMEIVKDQLMKDLEKSNKVNAQYLKAIQEIASVAATVSETASSTDTPLENW